MLPHILRLMLDVTCIIINYNSSSYTISCIDSILKHTSSNLKFEIVITDNASKIEDYKKLENHVNALNNSAIILKRSLINTGFGGGNMHGVQFANPSSYLAFINNDVEIDDDVLSQLKVKMDADQSIGVCSPQMYDGDGNWVQTIGAFPSIGEHVLKRRLMEKLFPNAHPKRKEKHTKPTKANLVIGSFMFFRADDFCNVGGFDTNLFLYYEEADICYRLAQQNKSAYLFPSLKYTHHISKSTGSNKNKTIEIENHLSLLYILRKNHGFLSYIIVLNFMRLQYGIKSIFKSKKRHLFLALLRGLPLSKSLKQQQSILTYDY